MLTTPIFRSTALQAGVSSTAPPGRLSGGGRPPRYQDADESEDDKDNWEWAPPVLPEGRSTMRALAPGPKESEQYKQASNPATGSPHVPKAIPRRQTRESQSVRDHAAPELGDGVSFRAG